MGGKTTPCSLSGLARKILMGVSVSVACLASSTAAMASTHHKSSHSAHTTHHAVASTGRARHVVSNHRAGHNHTVAASSRSSHLRYAQYRHSGLQCVPYAREVSHVDLSGNAYLWWAEAAGRYARGNAPEEGAVLNFRSIGRMPLGHVAVVTAVMDSRTILITQANWVPGSITNDVTVQDVSANNDWSQVKVELGDSSKWGAPYPTYGFIYNRPDTGIVVASNSQGNEVAEAPAATQVSNEAPDRNLQ